MGSRLLSVLASTTALALLTGLAGVAGVLPRTRMHMEGDTLVLWLPKDLAALEGERPFRRLRQLARFVNASARIEIEGGQPHEIAVDDD